jgi:hypothetical protein
MELFAQADNPRLTSTLRHVQNTIRIRTIRSHAGDNYDDGENVRPKKAERGADMAPHHPPLLRVRSITLGR